MARIEPTETSEELIAAALQAGFKVSHSQLVRWHVAGALPRPTQVSLGKPLGSVTLYPTGTALQLMRLGQLHAREKRLPYVTWALWWEGYPVSTETARQFLTVIAGDLDATLTKLRRLLADEDEGPLLEKTITARVGHALVRQVRKRVGSKKFPQVVDLILRIATGSFTGFGYLNEDQEVFQKGLGLDRAQTDGLYSAPPWLKDPEEPLVKLSELLKDASFSQTLMEASDVELEGARAELRRFMTLMEGFGRTTGHRFGRGAFGLALIGVAQHFMRVEDCARQCLLWLRVRQSTEMHQGMATILETAPVVDEMVRASLALDVMEVEIPAFASLTTPARMRAAARSAEAHQRHLQDLKATYEANRDAVEDFKARHPELALEDDKT